MDYLMTTDSSDEEGVVIVNLGKSTGGTMSTDAVSAMMEIMMQTKIDKMQTDFNEKFAKQAADLKTDFNEKLAKQVSDLKIDFNEKFAKQEVVDTEMTKKVSALSKQLEQMQIQKKSVEDRLALLTQSSQEAMEVMKLLGELEISFKRDPNDPVAKEKLKKLLEKFPDTKAALPSVLEEIKDDNDESKDGEKGGYCKKIIVGGIVFIVVYSFVGIPWAIAAVAIGSHFV